MKIYYFSYTRFPSEKAHAVYLAKVIESFDLLEDVDTALIVPNSVGASNEDPTEYYNLKSSIKVVKLPTFPFIRSKLLRIPTYYLSIFSFSLFSFIYALIFTKKDDVLIGNDAPVMYLLSLLNRVSVYELHDYPHQKLSLYKKIFKSVSLIHTNNAQKKEKLQQDFNVSEEKIFVVHNGVTVDDFDISISKEEAREKLELNTEAKLVVYTGHLFDWKGADVLAEAMKSRPEYTTLFVGGTESDAARMSEEYKDFSHIVFTGHKPHKKIPLYQKAADVLVLPNTAKKEISLYHTSPMKVFEYMASKTPIVASDIPSIREILNETSAYMIEPDNSEVLANAIDKVFSGCNNNQELVTKAFADVQQFSWIKRAEKYVGKIYNCLV